MGRWTAAAALLAVALAGCAPANKLTVVPAPVATGADRVDLAMATPWEPPFNVAAKTGARPVLPPPLPVPRPSVILASTEPVTSLTIDLGRDASASQQQSTNEAVDTGTEVPLAARDLTPRARGLPATTAPIPPGGTLSEPGYVEQAGTDPGWLIGLDQEGTLYLLGEPSKRLDQPPARVWQYNGNNCTLRLFLYLDMVSVRYRTLFYEIRGVNAEDINARRRCVAWLLADRSSRS